MTQWPPGYPPGQGPQYPQGPQFPPGPQGPQFPPGPPVPPGGSGWYPGGPQPPRRQVPGAIVVLLTMLVGLGVLASVVTVVRVLQGSEGRLETTAAVDGLDGVVDEADFDDEPFDELDGCPFGATRATIRQVVEPLSDDAMTNIAEEGSPDEAAFDVEGTPSVVCGLAIESDDEDEDEDESADAGLSSIGLAAVAVESGDDVDVEGFVHDFAENLAGHDDVDFTAADDHRGGQFFHICVEYEDDSDGTPYCEVDWADEELLVTLYFVGSESDSIDLDGAEDALAGSLDELVDGLAGA